MLYRREARGILITTSVFIINDLEETFKMHGCNGTSFDNLIMCYICVTFVFSYICFTVS